VAVRELLAAHQAQEVKTIGDALMLRTADVSAAAAGGEVLVTAMTRAAAGDVEGVELRERGRWSFRNVGGLVEV
jgi:class 3 adenylate cyclase